MNIGRLLKYCLGFFLFFFVYACQNDTVYYTYNPVPDQGWKREDTLHFCIPDTLKSGIYNLEVGVRHSVKYPYRDLWLELTQYIPGDSPDDGWEKKKDTIHLYLANDKGNWNGTGTTGGHFQLISPAGTFTLHADSINNNVAVHSSDVVGGINESTNISKNTPFNDLKHKGGKKKYTFVGKQHKIGKDARHHLDVVHIMSDSVLMHISDIGLRLSTLTD